jgi:hypothetical protein
MLGAGLGLTGVLLYLLFRDQGNFVVTIVAFSALFCCIAYSKVGAMMITLSYLFFMGDIRRIRDVVLPHPAFDPLILIPAASALVLGLPVLMNVRVRDPLSKAMLCLTALMAIQILNPSQGGIAVGLGGALFYLVPVLWFWIGRAFGTPSVLEACLYRIVLPISVLAAVMGLYQNFVGFLPYQQLWIDANRKTFTILNLAGGTRSFGFSGAPSEYMTLLQIGAATSIGAWLGGRRLWLLAFPVLFAAMVMSSGRGVVIRLVFAMAFIWVARRTKSFGVGATIRLGFFLILGLSAMTFIAGRFAPTTGDYSTAKTANAAALAHETQGLADPLNPKSSTAALHSSIALGGILEGLKYPIGHGLGSTTAAAIKLGSGYAQDTEVDITDMFICLGLVGGILYLFIVVTTVNYSLVLVRTSKVVGLPVLAILSGGLSVWLLVSQYSSSALYMFLVGCLAHMYNTSRSTADRAVQRLEPRRLISTRLPVTIPGRPLPR